MFLVLFAFLVGFSAGAWLGRREGRKEAAAAVPPGPAAPVPAPPSSAPAPSPAPLEGPPTAMPPTPLPVPPPAGPPLAVSPTLLPPPSPAAAPPPPPVAPAAGVPGPSLLGGAPIVPNKRARKAGLTPADFVPKDDILLRMQEAWERGETLEEPERRDLAQSPDLAWKLDRVLARLGDAPAGEGDETMPEPASEGVAPEAPAPESAPSAGTLSEGVAELEALGYGDELRWQDGALVCRRCGERHDAEHAEVEQVRRYEGQSDPADEAILLGLRCPNCGTKGSIVSTYGPDADPELAQAFVYLAGRVERS